MVATSIIVPLYGGLALTQSCFAALQRTLAHREDVELVFVDNASPDDTRTWLRSIECPGVVVVELDENQNFSGGCNAGVAAASGATIVLLNNDTEPQPGWLEALEAQLLDETVGIVGALLTYPDGTVQHGGVAFPTGKLPEHVHVGADPEDASVKRSRDLQAVTAACCALRRSTWDTLDGLDDGYVNGMEDMDLCLRARAHGVRVVYEPRARIVHHESKSDGRFQYATANIQRFLAAHGARLVPDLHAWDRSSYWPENDVIRPQDVPGTDNAALRGWTERRELVRRVGGMDLSLPEDARVADWLDRVRLCGGVVLEDGIDTWSCRGGEAELAAGNAEAERSLVRRWGTCDPSLRTEVQFLPLSDRVQSLDAEVRVDAREFSYLLSTEDHAQLERVARLVLEEFDEPQLRSLVVRIAPGDDDAYDALGRAADAADVPDFDIVVVEAGADAELALARPCRCVLVFGDDEQELALTSLAFAAGVDRHHPGMVSDQQSG